MPRAKKTSDKTPSKSDFIRGLPGLSAKEVVAKASEAGLSLTENHVHAVRSGDRVKGSGPKKKKHSNGRAKPHAAKAAAAPKKSGRVPAGKSEDLLFAVASEIGLARSIAILEEQRRRVRAVVGS